MIFEDGTLVKKALEAKRELISSLVLKPSVSTFGVKLNITLFLEGQFEIFEGTEDNRYENSLGNTLDVDYFVSPGKNGYIIIYKGFGQFRYTAECFGGEGCNVEESIFTTINVILFAAAGIVVFITIFIIVICCCCKNKSSP